MRKSERTLTLDVPKGLTLTLPKYESLLISYWNFYSLIYVMNVFYFYLKIKHVFDFYNFFFSYFRFLGFQYFGNISLITFLSKQTFSFKINKNVVVNYKDGIMSISHIALRLEIAESFPLLPHLHFVGKLHINRWFVSGNF